MSLKALLLEEMVRVSEPWIDPEKDAHRILSETELLVGISGLVAEAHRALVETLPENDERAAQLTREMAEADAEHDRRLRLVYETMNVLAAMEDTGEIQALLDKILPDGLAHNTRTYRAEAGHTLLVQARLTAADKALMKAQKVGGTHLFAIVESWLEAGRTLGELEEERVQLDGPGKSATGAINAVRLRWIQVVNALVALAKLAGLSEEEDRVLFAALRDAERKSDERRGRGRDETVLDEETIMAAPDTERGESDESGASHSPAVAALAGGTLPSK